MIPRLLPLPTVPPLGAIILPYPMLPCPNCSLLGPKLGICGCRLPAPRHSSSFSEPSHSPCLPPPLLHLLSDSPLCHLPPPISLSCPHLCLPICHLISFDPNMGFDPAHGYRFIISLA